MEIWDRHKEKREYRGDVFPLNTDHSIKRVGLERCGLHRSYCAFFTLDGTVTYEGSGRGLEGKAKGTIDKSGIHGIFNLLEKTDLNSLADIYHLRVLKSFLISNHFMTHSYKSKLKNPQKSFSSVILPNLPFFAS